MSRCRSIDVTSEDCVLRCRLDDGHHGAHTGRFATSGSGASLEHYWHDDSRRCFVLTDRHERNLADLMRPSQVDLSAHTSAGSTEDGR